MSCSFVYISKLCLFSEDGPFCGPKRSEQIFFLQ